MKYLIWLFMKRFKVRHRQWTYKGHWVSIKCGKIGVGEE